MLSADIFVYVENILAAALGFLHSIVFSMVMLWKHPKSAPRFLTRRLKDTSIRQVGPLTLCFICVLFAMTPIFYISNGTIKGIVSEVFSDDDKTSVVKVVGTCFAGAVLIDLVGRICAAFGWPRRGHTIRYNMREKEQIRKTRICYTLCIPSLFSAVSFIIAPILGLFVFVYVFNGSIFSDYLVPFIMAIWALSSWASIRFIHPTFIHLLDGGPEGEFKQTIVYFGKEALIPIIIAAQYFSLTFSYSKLPTLYPKKPTESTDYNDGVSAKIVSCNYISNRYVKLQIALTNKSANPKIYFQSGRFSVLDGLYETSTSLFEDTLIYKNKSGRDVLIDMSPKSNKIIEIDTREIAIPQSDLRYCQYEFDTIAADNLKTDRHELSYN